MTKTASHNKVWNREAECMPLEERRALQLKRLQNLLQYVYAKIPFYRELYDKNKFKPEDVKTLDDLKRIPFTEKKHLRDTYPFGLFATGLDKVVRLHASSGTTGKPVVSGFSRADLDTWSEIMARSLTMAGADYNDVVHNAYGYGLFTGGLGLHMGAERIDSAVVPASAGLNNRQIMLMKDFGATVLVCTPSYALVLAETAENLGVDIRSDLKLKAGVFGAEPWTEEMRQQIQERLNLEAYDIFGMGELMGPGVACECTNHNGMHIQDDIFLPEIIDKDSGESLPAGEQGELVFTTLTKEVMPLVRYRTRDITVLDEELCPCGRTSVRFHKLAGRTDDMLIIRGVNVFPSQVETVLLRFEELAPQYVLVVDKVNNLDTLEVQVESKEGHDYSDQYIEELTKKVQAEMQQLLYISVRVTIVPPKTIKRSEGKAKRIDDRRK